MAAPAYEAVFEAALYRLALRFGLGSVPPAVVEARRIWFARDRGVSCEAAAEHALAALGEHGLADEIRSSVAAARAEREIA